MPSVETFSESERERLAPHFTNVDADVFGLKLPQEVAGALFSRYSRSAKSLRRVFLDEFFQDEGAALETPAGADEAVRRARAFYDRVLVGYGDDSVSQLGGAHVACERVSNVAAKLLEDARVGIAFLEKSTRYVRFDQKDEAGRWLYHEEAAISRSKHREAYVSLMEDLFETYARQIDPMIAFLGKSLPIESVEVRHPRTGEPLPWKDVEKDAELRKSAERAYRSTVRAHACDVMRGYLPGATLTNLGVFGSGQAYEHLVDKLASQELAEGRALAGAVRRELDSLIPSFVKRSGKSEYLVRVGARSRALAPRGRPAPSPGPSVTLLDFDAAAEEKVLAALMYPASALPLDELRRRASAMNPAERLEAFEGFAGERRNRRDKPGRALENVTYSFDILANFGIYRDLQRHRLLTQERQDFTTAHGHDTPPELSEIGFLPEFQGCMERAHELHERLASDFPLEAQYVVPFAFRVRWYVKLSLREAIHLCELRSMPQGHPDYRSVVQDMWRQVEAVHPSLAAFGRFVNRDTYRLGRLQSELRTEWKKERMTT